MEGEVVHDLPPRLRAEVQAGRREMAEFREETRIAIASLRTEVKRIYWFLGLGVSLAGAVLAKLLS